MPRTRQTFSLVRITNTFLCITSKIYNQKKFCDSTCVSPKKILCITLCMTKNLLEIEKKTADLRKNFDVVMLTICFISPTAKVDSLFF